MRPMRKRGRPDEAGRAAIRALLESPKFELIPLRNVLEQARFLPAGATVSVTASPTKTLEDTVELAEGLSEMGLAAIPHLSARMTKDRAHLASLLERMERAGLRRIFLVGGDAKHPGEFYDAYSLLRAMNEMGHHLTEIGITSYPEGHPLIPNPKLRQALRDKQPHASYMTTQMCFDPQAIGDFIRGRRADGIALPVHLGLPGVAERLKLISISTRIGVGQSVRFLSKHRGLAGRFLKPGGYTPAPLLEGLAPVLCDPQANVRGLHIYTFNQCETTERWRTEYLEALR